MLRTKSLTFLLSIPSIMIANLSVFARSEQESNKSYKQSDSKIIKEFDLYAKKAIEELRIPYIMYGLVIDGKIAKTQCINNDKIPHKHAKTNTIVPISSVTKNITGALYSILYDKDIININTKITNFFDDLIIANENLTNDLTVQDLLCMRVGIEGFYGTFFMLCGYPRETILKTLVYAKERPNQVHKYFAYQNITYGLLDDIAEAQAGISYEKLIKKYVFRQMGMYDSSVENLNNRSNYFGNILFHFKNFSLNSKQYGIIGAVARIFGSFFGLYKPDIGELYRVTDDNVENLEYSDVFTIFPASSGVSTTISDMTKYLECITCNKGIDGEQLMSESTYKLMLSDMAEINEVDTNNFAFNKNRVQKASYGFGAMNLTYKGDHKIHGHYGGVLGVTSSIWFDPDMKIGVVLICPVGGHNESTLAQKLSYKFFDLYYGFDDIDWIQKEKDHINMSKTISKFGVINNAFSNQSNIHEYIGRYTYNNIINYSVRQVNNDLILLDETRNISFKLKHALYNIFYYNKSDIIPQESKIPLVCKFHNNNMIFENEKGSTITFKKIK